MTDTYSTTNPDLRNQTAVTRPAAPSTLSMTDREVMLDPDGVAVRGAIIDDGALLWELARDAGGIDLNTPYAYMMQCRNFHETCAVAEVFGTPAGFVTAHRLPKAPQVLFVWQVAVLPEFRGLGIGQRLLEGLVELPSCKGVRKLEATVTPSNKASEALFTAFAKGRDAAIEFGAGFARDEFPDDEPQERERLVVVHPIHSIE
jgi:L-2,4-diaminobutyric acid acetyltransferase